VHVWRLGVEIPPRVVPRTPDGTVRMVMVGRFVEKKGFAYGLQAFARVAGRHAHARMILVGDGERRAELEAIVREAGLGARVQLTGVLPHAEVFEQIENADVLVAPSVVGRAGNRESGLLVVKEANARGLPAIGTRHGGIPEIIDDERTGFLVPERDVDALADRIDRLLSDPGLRTRMGAAAREKMEREYDIVQRVDALEDHYDAVLVEHRTRARRRGVG
jgi:glycosyltransferase involved in cell wall biosynthesis